MPIFFGPRKRLGYARPFSKTTHEKQRPPSKHAMHQKMVNKAVSSFFAVSILGTERGKKGGGGSPQEANKQTHVWEGRR